MLQIPQILTALEAVPCPVLDRTGIEKLFGLKRRQAISVLGSLGGYQSGKTFLIDRQALIAKLEAIRDGAAFVHETERRARVSAQLEAARKIAYARRISIPSAPDVRDRVLSDLPAGIHLKPGELRIEFFGTEDLLRNLYELAQAILNDYPRFQNAVEGS